MIDKAIFFTWLIWYFYVYGPPPILFNFLVNFYYIYNDFFNCYNEIIYSSILYDEKSEQHDTIQITNESPKDPPKYEDKYLDDIRKLSKEWEFTDDENNHIPKLIEDFLNGYIETGQEKIEEITNQIISLEKEIAEDTDSFNYVEDFDDEGDSVSCENTSEERNSERRNKIQQLQEQYNNIKLQIQSDEGISGLKVNSEEQARQYIINERLDKLKNCYVIEKTPIGNVLMIYEKDRESFKYYSDCNIPYRYLEVVGRKYVKLFGCRPIFVDMEEELRLFEEKQEKIKAEEKLKEEKEK